MRKGIISALAAALGLAAALSGQPAQANTMFCNNNSNPRIFNGNTGLTVPGNLVFEMDFKFPDAATQPERNRQDMGVTLLTSDGGYPYAAGVQPGVGFRIEPGPSSEDTGAPERYELFYRDGLFSVDLASGQLSIPFDHQWHHIAFAAILAPGNNASNLGLLPLNGATRRPGIILAVDGLVQGQVAIPQINDIGLGVLFSGSIQHYNNAGSGNNNLPNIRQIRIDNLRLNGELIDSFENETGTIGAGTAGFPTNAAQIAAQPGLQNWLRGTGNNGQYMIDGPATTTGNSDGTAKQSDAMQGSVFLNATGVQNIVAADRSGAASDDLEINVDFRFPQSFANPSSSGESFSVIARLNGERGGGSYVPAQNGGGVECKISVSADSGGFFRAEVIDNTATGTAGASLGALLSTKAFDQKWHRLTFSLTGTAPDVSIDGASLGSYGSVSPAVAGVTDGENFSIAVNPGTGGTAARNPRFDNITVASGTNPAPVGAAVAIDDFSTYIPIELAGTTQGMGTLNQSAANLRANPTATAVPDTPWINGQVVATAGASDPPQFRMTNDNSNFGLTVNAVQGWTLY